MKWLKWLKCLVARRRWWLASEPRNRNRRTWLVTNDQRSSHSLLWLDVSRGTYKSTPKPAEGSIRDKLYWSCGFHKNPCPPSPPQKGRNSSLDLTNFNQNCFQRVQIFQISALRVLERKNPMVIGVDLRKSPDKCDQISVLVCFNFSCWFWDILTWGASETNTF